jgi:hypothetical protein
VRIPVAEIDFDARLMRLELPDGGVVEAAIREPDREPNIRRFRVDYMARTLWLQLPDGSSTTIEIHLGESAQRTFLGARTVVYLDQNHWSTIANWRSGTRPVSDVDAQAAEALGQLVDAGQVVLPISAGHLVETGALFEDRRVALACAVLELCRGWLMRNPVSVRLEELASARAGQATGASNVFTLAADQLFVRPLRKPNTTGMPAFIAELMAHLINASTVCDVLVDPEQIPDEGGRAAADSWGEAHARTAQVLRAKHAPRSTVRKVAHGRLLMDLHDEIRELWPDPREFDQWLPRSEGDVGRLPYLSRLRAVLYTRLRTASPWRTGDFIDLHYLCAAAGYADLVVGERRTISDLRQARGLTPGARLARSLPEALDVLADVCAAAGANDQP